MQEEYNGYTIRIEQDEDPINPREDDNLGIMLCFHKRYTLGDKTDLKYDMFDSWDAVEAHLIKKCKAKCIQPLYMYDHSGLRIKIGSFQGFLSQGHAEFDSGQIGFIYTTPKQIRLIHGRKKLDDDKINAALEAEVKIYDSYVSGSFVGYIIEKDDEELDSCWGYDDANYAIKDAKAVIDNYIKRQAEGELKLEYRTIAEAVKTT